MKAHQVGIMENPPLALPPPRLDAAPLPVDRFGALLLEDAPPRPDALEPAPREAPVLPLAFHFCFLGFAADFLPAGAWEDAAALLASCESANFWLKA
jgi:hypothetical protein